MRILKNDLKIIYLPLKYISYFAIFFIFCSATFTFLKWGPIFSSDTLVYFNLSKQVSMGKFPYSPFYSPGYPTLVSSIKTIFYLGFEDAASLISISFFFISIIISYFIIIEIRERKEWVENIFYSLFIGICWWSVTIVFSSHADSLFYVFCLFIILFLIKWLKSNNLFYFIIASLLSAASIWIKYNGLIFLPFLAIVPIYYFGICRKALLGLIPLLSNGISFILFKNINGQVIYHLETNSRVFEFWKKDISLITLLSNLSDSGKTFIDFTLTSYAWSFFSQLFYIFIFLLTSVIFFFYLIRKFSKESIESIFLLFSIVYFYGYLFMSQLTNHTEVNRRTMFPALLFFIFYLIIVLNRNKSIVFSGLIVIYAFLNLMRSGFGFIDWYKRAPMDSFVLVNEFKERRSLVNLNELLLKNNLLPENIYTNNVRYLVPYFDYEWVNSIPVKEKFMRGRYREVSNEFYDSINASMIKKIEERDAVLIIFDFQKSTYQFSEILNANKLIIGDDLILSKF
ncbi:MAG: hypothetical protein Q8M62_11155 [Algoriphagus sp.]|uniref:hypothetical protein n=1 Tax=Algoriphagus sp. TaxID=1872435 RepID=UPI002736B427|nr:hypothetical protein [Algoriphagus sp.]MDP3200379.1 hypothetical protein [Algoriphagus sp.]